ncbi:Bug family tripartite tricarboxylate transporter substrate binding protein [Humitalea sp. 24SJ18S-53]|uniref:Bug family tripartite tricarboxylate transporter substrate binding protein n=1 Tax=Humitalea sp. 24SJ18S-53 TaxID=3422307 RepID=UPI003D67EFE9
MFRRDTLLAVPFLAAAALSSRRGFAQAAFPNRPIRLIIPFTPGGSNDVVGRLLADGMAARLGQSVVVENRGGAGGVLGNDVVAKAAPDGHTVLLAGSGSFIISGLVQQRLPYDMQTGFAPIGFIGASPNVITTAPRLNVGSLAELQAVARVANPPLTYGTPGVGTNGHALGAMIGVELGVPLEPIHYRGTGPALNDILGGRLDILTNAAAPLQPHIAAGTLRAIAIAGPRRSPALPDVASSAEQGFPGLDSATWYALLATGGTPPDRIAILHAALNATLVDPEILRRLTEGGVEVESSASPQALGEFMETDRARWAAVVRRANLRAE